MSDAPLSVRTAGLDDAPRMADILNALIRRGGTTAHQREFTVEEFAERYLKGADLLSCVVAEPSADAPVAGFQFLGQHPDLPPGWGEIATFAQIEPKIPGVGTALFQATRAHAARLGLVAINATIRADNSVGLGFYSKMGFADYAVTTAKPLANGVPVDRLSKKFVLTKANGAES